MNDKEEIFKTPYIELFYYPQKRLSVYRYLPDSADMSDEEYKEWNLKYAEAIEQHQIIYTLVDIKNMRFTIEPYLQEWTNEEINTRLVNAGVKKCALLTPEEFIIHLAAEQTTDEIEAHRPENQYKIRYFNNFAKAEKWLLEG